MTSPSSCSPSSLPVNAMVLIVSQVDWLYRGLGVWVDVKVSCAARKCDGCVWVGLFWRGTRWGTAEE